MIFVITEIHDSVRAHDIFNLLYAQATIGVRLGWSSREPGCKWGLAISWMKGSHIRIGKSIEQF